MKKEEKSEEGEVIFRPYYRKKDGTLVYPKRARVFRFVLKAKK